MHQVVATRRDELAAVCRRRGVTRLELFGSAARDDFDVESSDIDFLVEFDATAEPSGLSTYFDLKDELELLLGRPVDLVSVDMVRNPYVRASIERDRQLIYAA